jgi:hypothetical protein
MATGHFRAMSALTQRSALRKYSAVAGRRQSASVEPGGQSKNPCIHFASNREAIFFCVSDAVRDGAAPARDMIVEVRAREGSVRRKRGTSGRQS